MSVNTKRVDINLKDVLKIAENFSIKNPKKLIKAIQDSTSFWEMNAKEFSIPDHIIKSIRKDFTVLI
jgi:serine/threonine-protein kinase HipA